MLRIKNLFFGWLLLVLPGISQADTDWIQGVWTCVEYSSNFMASCRAQIKSTFSVDQFQNEAIAECTNGAIQYTNWGTYTLKGRGNTWALTFNPKGSIPPVKKLLKSTKTFWVSEDRRMMTSKLTSRMPDGSPVSNESQCQKIQ